MTIPDHLHKDFVTDVDGFKYFWPSPEGGHFAAHHLREIADHLDMLNEPIEEEYRLFWKEQDNGEKQIT